MYVSGKPGQDGRGVAGVQVLEVVSGQRGTVARSTDLVAVDVELVPVVGFHGHEVNGGGDGDERRVVGGAANPTLDSVAADTVDRIVIVGLVVIQVHVGGAATPVLLDDLDTGIFHTGDDGHVTVATTAEADDVPSLRSSSSTIGIGRKAGVVRRNVRVGVLSTTGLTTRDAGEAVEALHVFDTLAVTIASTRVGTVGVCHDAIEAAESSMVTVFAGCRSLPHESEHHEHAQDEDTQSAFHDEPRLLCRSIPVRENSRTGYYSLHVRE